MKNIFKRKRVLYILPLLSVSLFTVGFSSWSFINTSEQYSNFKVDSSTGTVIDISDCIALNGEITNIKYYSSGFLIMNSNNSYEKSSTGNLIIPLKFTRRDYSFQITIDISFVNHDDSLSNINFSTYVDSCQVLDGNSSLLGVATPMPISDSSKNVRYNYTFTQSVESFQIKFSLKSFDDTLYSYLSNSSNYLSFSLTTEIV